MCRQKIRHESLPDVVAPIMKLVNKVYVRSYIMQLIFNENVFGVFWTFYGIMRPNDLVADLKFYILLETRFPMIATRLQTTLDTVDDIMTMVLLNPNTVLDSYDEQLETTSLSEMLPIIRNTIPNHTNQDFMNMIERLYSILETKQSDPEFLKTYPQLVSVQDDAFGKHLLKRMHECTSTLKMDSDDAFMRRLFEPGVTV